MHRFVRVVAVVCAAALIVFPLAGGAQQSPPAPASSPSPGPTPGPGALSVPFADPYPSTYTPFPSRPTLIRGATLLTAAGPVIRNGSILL
ncbi:MAG: hypothetical protein M3N13_01205, partial [Candidatus Eremiobacteraeota bacterium]|nr:hypothetical protein [Candidatus Eremiobacteraeota bacterium]